MKTDGAKGRTEREYSDRVEDIVPDNAGWRGNDERRHDGKHRSIQEPVPLWMVPDNGLTAGVSSEPPYAEPHVRWCGLSITHKYRVF